MEQIKTKQRMKGAALQIVDGEHGINTNAMARADSVIRGVYCLNITQNLSCLP